MPDAALQAGLHSAPTTSKLQQQRGLHDLQGSAPGTLQTCHRLMSPVSSWAMAHTPLMQYTPLLPMAPMALLMPAPARLLHAEHPELTMPMAAAHTIPLPWETGSTMAMCIRHTASPFTSCSSYSADVSTGAANTICGCASGAPALQGAGQALGQAMLEAMI